MKKIILILIAALIVIYTALSVLGSSKEYAAEKLFYQSTKMIRTLAANPDVVPPAMAEAVEEKLRSVTTKYPDTNAARAAWITLAEFQMFGKKYDKARQTLDVVISGYKNDKGMVTRAIFMKGNAYERENQWNKALAEYKTLRDDYKNTSLGFQMPIYIADRYAQLGKDNEAARAYGDAEIFYSRIAKENKGSPAGYLASAILVRTYFNLKEFDRAGETVEEIINDYPSPNTYMQQLPNVDFIFVKQLNKPERAIAIYKSVIEKTSDKRLQKLLEQKVSELGSKK